MSKNEEVAEFFRDAETKIAPKIFGEKILGVDSVVVSKDGFEEIHKVAPINKERKEQIDKLSLSDGPLVSVKLPYTANELKEIMDSGFNEPDDNSDYYNYFNVSVFDIINFIINHKKNKHLTNTQAFCMGNEIKYRLRAGIKTMDYENDINKALRYGVLRETRE